MTGLSDKEVRSILHRFIDMGLIEPAETRKTATNIYKMGQANAKISLNNIKSAGQAFPIEFVGVASKQSEATPSDIIIKSEPVYFFKKGQANHADLHGEVKNPGQASEKAGQATTM
jgi:hypothetical protein